MMNPANALIQVFCKTPRKGEVKTRLAATLGEDGALALYEDLIRHTLRGVQTSKLDHELWYMPDDHPLFASLVPNRYAQAGDDLGARMQNALTDGLSRAHAVILIGADLPSIDGAYLTGAAAALQNHNVVIGPAEDGGYGLIGVSGSVPAVFSGIRWSTGDVLADTCRLLNQQQVNYALLPTIWDIDRPADLVRFAQRVSV